jgi:hypothetical protein
MELYDLAIDPAESRDVAAVHLDIVERMEAIFAREHVPHPDWRLPLVDGRADAKPVNGRLGADGGTRAGDR